MFKLEQREYNREEFVADDVVKNIIKEDNDIINKILVGLVNIPVTEIKPEIVNAIKQRIFGITTHSGYNKESNQSYMIIHTLDVICALALHACTFDQIKELEKLIGEAKNDIKELNGMFDAITSSITGVFLYEESTNKFLELLQTIVHQLLGANVNTPDENTSLEVRYGSMNNSKMKFIDNIVAAVKTSTISTLSKQEPGIELNIEDDIFPDYISHILIADSLFGGVHILEIGN